MRQYMKLIGIVTIALIYALSYRIQAQEKPAAKPAQVKTYQLVTALKEGDKFDVSQSQKWEGNLAIEATAIGRSSNVFSKSIQNIYIEVIGPVTKTAIKSERTYTQSWLNSAIVTLEPEKGTKNEATSLQGKTIALETKDNQTTITKILNKENNVVLKEDLPYVTALTEYNNLLPPSAVKVGDTWQITDAQFGKVIFKEDYEEELCAVEGKATLAELTTYQGLKSAKISIILIATHKQTETAPELSVDLKGSCYYALDKKVIISVDLKGAFTLDKEVTLPNQSTVKIKATGKITLSSQVTPVENK